MNRFSFLYKQEEEISFLLTFVFLAYENPEERFNWTKEKLGYLASAFQSHRVQRPTCHGVN